MSELAIRFTERLDHVLIAPTAELYDVVSGDTVENACITGMNYNRGDDMTVTVSLELVLSQIEEGQRKRTRRGRTKGTR